MAIGHQLSDANGSGTGLGQSATDTISFYGATPVAQRAASIQANEGQVRRYLAGAESQHRSPHQGQGLQGQPASIPAPAAGWERGAMTSKEILEKPAADMSTNSWLREVCIQLALLNEKPAPQSVPAKPQQQYQPGRR